MRNEHFLPITSAYNFRDLGGYIGANGRTLKKGLIIRSGDFSNLSPQDADYLENMPIRTVVDLRAKDEIDLIPDYKLKSVDNHIELSVNSGNLVPQFHDLIAKMENKTISVEEGMKRGTELMISLYIDMVSNFNHIFKEIFKLLQNNQVPLLFHCTAGKDRTGLTASLILYALGVDMKTIIDDYLLTNEGLQGKYDHLDAYGPISEFFKTVKPVYLQSAFDFIHKNYKSLDNYICSVLDVDVNRLRELYLD